MGLFIDVGFSTFLIPLFQCPIMPYILHDIHIYVPNHSDNFNVCSTWDIPQSIQKNGGVVSKNPNWAKLHITN
jgi:hypothetical protein